MASKNVIVLQMGTFMSFIRALYNQWEMFIHILYIYVSIYLSILSIYLSILYSNNPTSPHANTNPKIPIEKKRIRSEFAAHSPRLCTPDPRTIPAANPTHLIGIPS